jgi:hypothetical protein
MVMMVLGAPLDGERVMVGGNTVNEAVAAFGVAALSAARTVFVPGVVPVGMVSCTKKSSVAPVVSIVVRLVAAAVFQAMPPRVMLLAGMLGVTPAPVYSYPSMVMVEPTVASVGLTESLGNWVKVGSVIPAQTVIAPAAVGEPRPAPSRQVTTPDPIGNAVTTKLPLASESVPVPA